MMISKIRFYLKWYEFSLKRNIRSNIKKKISLDKKCYIKNAQNLEIFGIDQSF